MTNSNRVFKNKWEGQIGHHGQTITKGKKLHWKGRRMELGRVGRWRVNMAKACILNCQRVNENIFNLKGEKKRGENAQ